MPNINQENASSLLKYDITVCKELKSAIIVRLKDRLNDSRMSRSLYDKLITAIHNYDNIHSNILLPKITFGVELEFVGSKNHNDVKAFNAAMRKLLRSKYFYSGLYTHNDGHSWILGRDGSIKTDKSLLDDPYGFELSSPKLRLFNDKDVELLTNVLNLIKDKLHAEVNESCGTHVHIGFDKPNTFRGSIVDLLSVYSYMESKVFDPIVPKNRRRNRYCKKTQPWLRNKYQKLSSRFCEFNYDGLCKKLHFEFRQLEGTLDLNTILYWVILQSHILYDLLDHIYDDNYRANLALMNIFDVLFYYNFNNDLINFFINRVINFKSRTI